jgi:16S rRNA (guanine527-N7)-methyltransferase
MTVTTQAERLAFQKVIGVSHETLTKFDRYAEILIEWNQKFNLVSESTLPHIWSRHFLDSAQLFKHIDPAGKHIADLGSGAGFPGLVLSIMGIPGIRLIESTRKKAAFLDTVIAELGLTAKTCNERIETMQQTFDIMTARALKPLSDMLPLIHKIMRKNAKLVLLKGENLDIELAAAAKFWTFQTEKIPSITSPFGSVVIIRDIGLKHDAPRRVKRSLIKRPGS